MTAGGLTRPTVVLLVVWACSAVYLSFFIDRGWIPHDEGAFAHSAERVLQGELPHRDFDEIYTGGLSYLHALGFELFGVRLTSLRYVLLGFTLAFVPALFALTSRLGPPWLAGALTLLGVVASVPNYFAGVPSWYNLFFATFGTLALVRHLEDGRRRWLVIAGICGGLSILIKIAGLYFVAAALLFLVYREQSTSRDLAARAARVWGLVAIEVVGAVAFVVVLLRTFAPSRSVMEIVHFVVPGAVLVALLPWREFRDGGGSLAPRVRGLLTLVLPFLAGVALPLAFFVLPYVASGAVGDLIRGLFVLPARRVQAAAMALPPPYTLTLALPYAALLALPVLPKLAERILAAALAATLAVVLWKAGDDTFVYLSIWWGLRPLVPLAAIAAFVVLARPGSTRDAAKHQLVFLFAAVAAMTSLVQFPYAFGIYFCYAAPLVMLAIAALVAARPSPRLLHLVVLAFYLAFAGLWLNRGFIRSIGLRYIPDGQTARLNLPRAGLLVYEDRKLQYEELIALVERHADTDFIYAAPDVPEMYFLAARRNPTRTIFDIFDEPAGRTARILAALDARHVKVAVINSKPEFSPPLDDGLAEGLARRFSNWTRFGRYEVGWRP